MPLMTWYDVTLRADFLSLIPEPIFDAVIGNPPYAPAEKFVRHAIQFLKPEGILIYLLPLNFLASMGRVVLFDLHYPIKTVYVCNDRPSFTGDDKSDSREYAFFIWEKGYAGETTVRTSLSYPKNKDRYGNHQLQLL